MSLSFSFFSQREPGSDASVFSQEPYGEVSSQSDAPSLWTKYEEISSFPQDLTPELELPAPPTAIPLTTGLAALAVQQSLSGPVIPHSRKLSSYMPPGPAIAAGLALVSQATAEPLPMSMPVPQHSQATPAPSTNHFHAMHALQHQDVAQLRLDMQTEIEQVRQDIFGAAMGVSALKDRLDGVESSLSQPPPAGAAPTLSKEDVDRLVRDWLDAHLPHVVEESVQKSLEQALQQTVATLSSSEFFRMPVHMAGQFSDTHLTQAPQILSSSLS